MYLVDNSNVEPHSSKSHLIQLALSRINISIFLPDRWMKKLLIRLYPWHTCSFLSMLLCLLRSAVIEPKSIMTTCRYCWHSNSNLIYQNFLSVVDRKYLPPYPIFYYCYHFLIKIIWFWLVLENDKICFHGNLSRISISTILFVFSRLPHSVWATMDFNLLWI